MARRECVCVLKLFPNTSTSQKNSRVHSAPYHAVRRAHVPRVTLNVKQTKGLSHMKSSCTKSFFYAH